MIRALAESRVLWAVAVILAATALVRVATAAHRIAEAKMVRTF